MTETTTTLDDYRTGYIAQRHDLSDNCARALQLFELGYSSSGAAKQLPVTESTVRSYLDRIEDKICLAATFSIGGRERKASLDVWGDRDVSEYGTLSYEDGAADARRKNETERPPTPKELLDPHFRERELSINRGVPLEEIPDKLITIKTGKT
jgi:DNA-binding CsgD family transcriptional regulator